MDEDKLEEKILAVEEALKNENWEEAEKLLNTLLEIIPDHPGYLLSLGQCYLALDKPLNALLVLKKCTLEPFIEELLLNLLVATYESLFLDELAIQTARRLIEIEKGSEPIYKSLASIIFRHGCPNEAMEITKEGLTIYPSSDGLKYLLGMLYLYLKDKKEALTIYNQLKEEGSSFASVLLQFIEKDDPVIDKIETAKNKQQAEDHYLRAWQLLRSGESNMAVHELIDALNLDFGHAKAYTLLGCIYDNHGLIDEGLTLHRRAIEKDPNLSMAYNNIGYVFQIKGELQHAIDAYTRALDIDPNLVETRNSIGVLFDNIGDYEKGILHFQQALKIDPDRETTWRNLGFAFEHLRKIDDAITAYKTAIKIDTYSECRNMLATLYYELKRYKDAEAELLEIVKIDPDSPNAWVRLALCYSELGDEEKLCPAMEKAISLPPRSLQELFTKAQLMEIADKNVAIECWTQFLIIADKQYVEPEKVLYAKNRLDNLIGSTH
jgi:tetratricopeptide (TPR) repeat protein